MVDLQKLYLRLPVGLQNAAVSTYGFFHHRRRFGRDWRHLVREYRDRLSWSDDRVKYYIDGILSQRLTDAVINVPFYRDLYREHGVDIASLTRDFDLSAVPVISKSDVKANRERMIAPHVNSSHWVKTSGTTGSGLQFPATASHSSHFWAVWGRYFLENGIDPSKEWCGQFAGKVMVRSAPGDNTFWRLNSGGRQVRFSIFHIREDTLLYYVDALRKYRPRWLHGYPSAIGLLASYMVNRGIDLGYQVKWISFGSENALESHRTNIQRAFGVVPIEHYGMAEGVANASMINEQYLIDEDFSVCELLETSTSGVYKVIGTSLHNPAFPLIRYDVGDFISASSQRSALGWRLIDSIDGRSDDYILLPTGAKVSRLGYVFRDLSEISEAQIIQVAPLEIIVEAVCERVDQREHCALRIMENLRQRVGGAMKIEIRWVTHVTRTSSGKIRMVRSLIR